MSPSRETKKWVCRFVVVAAAASLPMLVQAQVTLRGLGDLPGGRFESIAYGVSADGSTVVGASHDRDIPSFPMTAFRWKADTGMVSLGRLDAPFNRGSIAYGVSADGETVAGHGMDYMPDKVQEYPLAAFLWTPEDGLLGIGPFRSIRAVSDDATVAAGPQHSFNPTAAGAPATWIRDRGWEMLGPPAPGAVNDAAYTLCITPDGAAIGGGMLMLDQSMLPFIWREETGFQFFGRIPGVLMFAFVTGLSADGEVSVGEIWEEQIGRTEAFRWDAATDKLIRLGTLPSESSRSTAQAVSRDGRTVYGASRTTLPGGNAFVWDERHGMRQLAAVLADEYGFDLKGWRLHSVNAVSADGRTLVGGGANPNGQSEAWILTLPSPCTADWNADSILNSQDFFDFLLAFFAGEADFNSDGATDTQDFFDFLTAFFAGCG